MILTNSGVLKLMQRIKSYIASQLNTKAPSVHTHTISEIDDLSTLSMGGGYTKSEVDTLLNGKADTSHTHTKSQITDFPNLSTVATSGSYNDLSNKPTIPTVNNATLTIQKNGTDVKTFTANSNTDVTCNITVPTKVSDLTNDSGFLTSSGSCNYANSAGTASSATTAGAVSTSVPIGSTKDLVYAYMADNDAFRIRCGGDSDAGYVEIATSDNGNEPIYVRQYSWNNTELGAFDQIVRTLTLLDGSGNTQFPGTVTASTFTGNLTGNCSGSAGSVAWNNVSGKPTIPTKTSDLTNDSCIPLSGTNALAGSIVPSTDNSVDLGSSSKNIKMLYTKGITINGTQFLPSDYIPRSGGAVISGRTLARTVTNDLIAIDGGTDYTNGAELALYGKDSIQPNMFGLYTFDSTNTTRYPLLGIGSTLSWSGSPIQYVSDQRFKQQIAEIDNKLLDAWQDVDLVQFKYNDAVDSKGTKARLHTGFVVQQIDTACKSHGVDISEYGLYCHEEYPEETEEVEVTQDDGTTTKETKVIREASEHYSLRYTETLVVECAYLRRENDKLKQQIQQILETLDVHSKILNSIN